MQPLTNKCLLRLEVGTAKPGFEATRNLPHRPRLLSNLRVSINLPQKQALASPAEFPLKTCWSPGLMLLSAYRQIVQVLVIPNKQDDKQFKERGRLLPNSKEAPNSICVACDPKRRIPAKSVRVIGAFSPPARRRIDHLERISSARRF